MKSIGLSLFWTELARFSRRFSNPSGLSIWACAFNATCSMDAQGNKPCGRTVLGPFSWGHMGDNTDLNPKNTTAWGVVWLRTNASKISTTFAVLGEQRPSIRAEGGGPPPPPPRKYARNIHAIFTMN